MDRIKFWYLTHQEVTQDNTMAHFTKLGVGNIVENVIVVHNDELLVDGVEQEHKGVEFLNNLFNERAVWKQTSYNTHGGIHKLGGTPFRKNHAGIGYTYDQDRDAFIPPKPFPSWILNEDTCNWDAPTPYPDDGERYSWVEQSQSWVIDDG